MQLFTGGGTFSGDFAATFQGRNLGGLAWHFGKMILRKSPPAAAVVLAARAIYEVGSNIHSNEPAAPENLFRLSRVPAAAIEMPPMWLRDP